MVSSYFSHVDDDVTGGVDDEHQVVPPGETVRQAAPVLDGPVGQHLQVLGGVRNVKTTVRALYFSPGMLRRYLVRV